MPERYHAAAGGSTSSFPASLTRERLCDRLPSTMGTAPPARSEADRFVDEETQFQLGFLPTEQPNPLTSDFHATACRDAAQGIELLLGADRLMAQLARRLLGSDTVERLRRSVLRILETKGRIFFGGCGASGRMAVQLEAMWRRSLREWADNNPSSRELCLEKAGCAGSVISGGELAVIQSVEYFEDHRTFGCRQVRDAGVGREDLFITLGEAGIAWITIGMALEADDVGAESYFVYCNPRSVMEERLDRCRELFARKRIHFLEAAPGPMALTGSTRMQATSLELICVGYALEWALASWARERSMIDVPPPETAADYGDKIVAMVEAFTAPESLAALAGQVRAETEVYREGGLVTYYANRYLIDILGDTTERTPTFALPPFPRFDRALDHPSWAFAKNPFYSTPDAWNALLQRAPIGLDWNADTYRGLGAPKALIAAPPDLRGKVCLEYAIGNEPDASRVGRHPALLVWADVGCELALAELPALSGYDEQFGFRIGARDCSGERFLVPIAVPEGVLSVGAHLSAKMAFNLVSTTTAALLGRIQGNWMVQVLPTNKKLVDRSIRILAELLSLPYREAAHLFFDTWEHMPEGERHAKSPVAKALSAHKS